MGVSLAGMHLKGLHLTGMHLIGVHLRGRRTSGALLELCPRPISLIHPGIQDFMGGYDYITVRAPLWLSHCGKKGVARKGCLKRVVPSHSVKIAQVKPLSLALAPYAKREVVQCVLAGICRF